VTTVRRRPWHGVTHGRVEFLSLHPARLQVARAVFTVADPALLRGVKLGHRVTIHWEEAGDVRLALRILAE
jgi:hypothetical protein